MGSFAFFILGGVVFLSSSCAPRAAFKRDYDFSRLKRLAVLRFQGAGGDAVSDILAQTLLSAGVTVIERREAEALLNERRLGQGALGDPAPAAEVGRLLGVDGVLAGSVLDFSPSQKYLVLLGTQTATGVLVVSNQVIPLSGSQVYSQGSAFGLPDSRIVIGSATVAVSTRLIDVKTGEVVWAQSENYEGLDIAAATEGVARALVRSLRKAWGFQSD